MIPFGLGAKLLGALAIMAAIHFGMQSLVNKGVQQCEAAHYETARRETDRRLAERVEIDNEAQRMQARNLAARASLNAAAPGLRDSLAGAVRSSCATTVIVSETAPSPARVLPDVLGEIEDRLRALATEADTARAAGIACERSYDSLNH